MLGFRPISPLPVTRYNLDMALVEARMKGKRIARLKPQPFSSLTEKIFYYESLPYMKDGMVDEIIFLAREAINGILQRGKPDLATRAIEKLEKGETLLRFGRFEERLKLITEAHEESISIFNSLSR